MMSVMTSLKLSFTSETTVPQEFSSPAGLSPCIYPDNPGIKTKSFAGYKATHMHMQLGSWDGLYDPRLHSSAEEQAA